MIAPMGLAEMVPEKKKNTVWRAVGREMVGKKHGAGEAK